MEERRHTEKVEDLFFQWCRRQFSQTNNNSMSKHKWRTEMDPRTEENETEATLKGTMGLPEQEREAIRQFI